jgi:hypothetical protein
MANVSGPVTCATCGRPLAAQQGRGRQRRYCDATCRSAARRDRSRATVNSDLTDTVRKGSLDSMVDSTADVAERVRTAADRFGAAWTEPDPLTAVAAARQLAGAVEETLRAAVDRARTAGRTWQEIGALLGTTRQAAFQRFGRPIDPRTGEPMSQTLLPGAAAHAVGLLVDYIEGRYDEVRRDFDQTMLDLLDGPKLDAGRAQLASMVGAYEGMGEPFAHALGEFTVVDVPMRFEAADMTGQVSYRQDGKVAGLYVLRPETV